MNIAQMRFPYIRGQTEYAAANFLRTKNAARFQKKKTDVTAHAFFNLFYVSFSNISRSMQSKVKCLDSKKAIHIECEFCFFFFQVFIALNYSLVELSLP